MFVSYHHALDRQYYEQLWIVLHDQYEIVYDKSPMQRIESNDPEYIIRRLREEHITGSSCTIVLVGSQTWGREYVDWKIAATLNQEHALIGVALPGAPITSYGSVVVPDRLHDNVCTRYATMIKWWELEKIPGYVPIWIGEANGRPKSWIDNHRPHRKSDA